MEQPKNLLQTEEIMVILRLIHEMVQAILQSHQANNKRDSPASHRQLWATCKQDKKNKQTNSR